jgi:hypothetical protein
MTSGHRPIVIVGLPRSGTTWTMRALAAAAGSTPISEADNEDKYPMLRPGDQAPPYRDLWDWILQGANETRRSLWARRLLGPGRETRLHQGRSDPITWLAGTLARDPRPRPADAGAGGTPRIVAKSIHAQLSVEWLAATFDIDVLLLLRHPASVLASWMELNLKDGRNSTLESRPEIRARYLEPWGVPQPGPDPIERMSWRIGLLIAAVEDAKSRHSEWQLQTHDELCIDPKSAFRQLYDGFGLPWGQPAEDFLDEHNTQGSGFVIKRVASELPNSWQHRLTEEQVTTLRRVLSWFPITTFGDEDFTVGRAT